MQSKKGRKKKFGVGFKQNDDDDDSVVELEEVGVFVLRLLHLDSYVILSRTYLLFCVINTLTE